MKKKKHPDKRRYKDKLKKKQMKTLQEDERIRNKSFDKIEQRLSEITDADLKIVRGTSHASMSEALLEFAEPFMDAINTDDMEAYEKAVMTAIVLWNCAVMQGEKGKEKEIKKLLKPLMRDDEGKSIVRYMLDRKQEMFPNNNRYIVDYELTDKGDGYHLSVASTIESESRSGDT